MLFVPGGLFMRRQIIGGYDQLLVLMDDTQLCRWTALIKQITEKFIIFFIFPGDGLEN